MKTFAIVSGAAAGMAAAMLSSSATTAAAPVGSESASDVVESLKAQGYNVMLNGTISEPFSECNVTGLHPDASGSAIAFTTVYVDVTCPDD